MESRYTIREPEKNDAKQIYDLVKKSKVLELKLALFIPSSNNSL